MKPEEAIAFLMNSNEYHHAIGDLPHSALSIEAFNMAIEALKEQRPHGKWEWKPPTPKTIIMPHCNICGHMNGFLNESNFCPNCGADMRKEVR